MNGRITLWLTLEKNDRLGSKSPYTEALMGLFGGRSSQPSGIVPKHLLSVHCFCTNDFRNSIGLTFYRFRKEESTRREYMSLLRSVRQHRDAFALRTGLD